MAKREKLLPLKFDDYERLRNYQLLIVDEFSFLRPDLFDAMDSRLRQVRECDAPFGGLILLVLGDPFQLPPVILRDEMPDLKKEYGENLHFLSAKVSQKLIAENQIAVVELHEIYRQQEVNFLEHLHSIRYGSEVSRREAFDFFNEHCYLGGEIDPEAITLAFTRMAVAEENSLSIKRLENSGRIDPMFDLFQDRLVFVMEHGDSEYERSKSRYPVEIIPYIGMHVMMLDNDSRGRWVNGSIAKIVSADANGIAITLCREGDDRIHHVDRVRLYDSSSNIARQIPLTPCYAITIHKSQGSTFDRVNINLQRNGSRKLGFELLYVALSRCKTVEGIRLREPLCINNFKESRGVVDFYRTLRTYQERMVP
ncbi:MAG: ATP-binding domain-containing protein [SAR324 cluster bacterium]|uniref:ATP-binding domain-containing protein n=1 Tax=SAR324 cluster bacterium TaxID=2024889 RepID=A0A7X9IJK9_9DELT|nr:ATP-binding domain-containing protein [SAR324 cluster bacterium]